VSYYLCFFPIRQLANIIPFAGDLALSVLMNGIFNHSGRLIFDGKEAAVMRSVG
jgi:hypothetical protein